MTDAHAPDASPQSTGSSDGQGEAGGESAAGEEGWSCDHCGRTFERERYLALHRGLDHEGDLSEAERAAFEEAREVERQQLRRFRLKALAALVVLYFGLLMAYAAFGI